MKYIILANSNDKTFDIPRQLVEINGEPLVKRTIRLLKENNVNLDDIIITAKDKRFDKLGVKRYEPINSTYSYITGKGYWLDAFPFELMNEPVCFIWGDVYFSENAIKTIVETQTDSTLFFCTYNNTSDMYIKNHDEPLAYKIVDTELFKEKVTEVKKLKDEKVCCREPIVWEVYRVINGIWVNEHKMTDNYIAINDESCDIDSLDDIIKLKEKVENMIKVEVIEKFNFKDYDKIKDSLIRKSIAIEGQLFVGDTFECDKKTADYLLGENPLNKAVVRVIEVEPIKDATFIEKETTTDSIQEVEETKTTTDAIKVVASRPSKKSKKK